MSGSIDSQDNDYAVSTLIATCQLAGEPSYLDDLRAELREARVLAAVARHDTPRLFEWLMSMLSFQGIPNRVARDFMDRHGNISWAEVEQALARSPSCPKLGGYWLFHDCRYHKTAGTCTEPDHLAACPLPRHTLRNGRLNQTAYSLFLFIRDIADGDLVTWIDRQVGTAESASMIANARDALLAPLRNVYGVSDKVLAMALSMLLIGAGKARPRWFEVGTTFIVIDTLVHNFLHRTGILRRFGADHAYGAACYQPNGCCDILESIAAQIDASAFNPEFPKAFPRFVQSAIWRYCAEGGLDVCNGNQINDERACDNIYCRLHPNCDRIALRSSTDANSLKMHDIAMI
jgi:hypothetical protein